MEIIEIPELPPQIKRAAELGELVIFIGAGMSYELGCRDWNGLANDLIKRCENTLGSDEPLLNNFEATQLKNMLEQSGNSKKVITICNGILSQSGNDELFLEEMKKSLNDDKVTSTNPKLKTYRDLLNLNGIFVTTNADRHIDQIFNPQNIITNKFTGSTALVNKNLYKIHGSINEPASLIFTVEQYFTRYKDKEFIKFLESLFTKTVLFVGYGLGEFELLEHMYKNITLSENHYFYLGGYYTHEKRLCDFEQMYFDQMKVKLIPYSKDKKGFKQLPIVIEEWVKQIQTTTNVLQNNFDEIDEVLRNPF
ncbi:MAG: SIR2 family protein [Sulfurimonas sp.]|uniref:SIR2 family protein n=1 Tax=Sulfurimonas sp. TaxID=2022749 RepID=UPI00261021E8|nr:SIR2 family protein [Sulfurimonas sp.]MDD3476947.1 SIR2 family protein [Sulfurimonas sp.]